MKFIEYLASKLSTLKQDELLSTNNINGKSTTELPLEFNSTRKEQSNIQSGMLFNNYGYKLTSNAVLSAFVSNPEGIKISEVSEILGLSMAPVRENVKYFIKMGYIEKIEGVVGTYRLIKEPEVTNGSANMKLVSQEVRNERTKKLKAKELVNKFEDSLKEIGISVEDLKDML